MLAAPFELSGDQYVIERLLRPFARFRVRSVEAGGAVVLEARERQLRVTNRIEFATADNRQPAFHVVGDEGLHGGYVSGEYAVSLPDSAELGRLRRNGVESLMLRAAWAVLGPDGNEIARVRERSTRAGLLRRSPFAFPLRLHADVVRGQSVAAKIDQQRGFRGRYLLDLRSAPPGALDSRVAIALVVVLNRFEKR